MNFGKQLKEGLITQNPVLVQVLGMCSTMAITTVFFNGVGMGLSVLIILTCSNIVISALRKVMPSDCSRGTPAAAMLSAVTVPRRSASAVSSSASDISIRRRQAVFSQVQRSWHLHRLSCRRRIRSPQVGHRTGTVSLNMSCVLSIFFCVLRPCFVFCIFS